MARVAQRIKQKSFKDWLYEEVCDEFGLTRVFLHPVLEQLNKITLPQNHPNRPELEELRHLRQW